MCDEKGVVWLAQIRSGIIGILADASVYLPASSFGADAGIVGCTAEKAGHRRSGLGNSGAVLQHLNRMPPAASIDTDVSKDVRLIIDPQRMEGEEVVSNAVVQLIFRTKVSDNIIGGQSIERKPTEVVKHVSKDQLVEIVRPIGRSTRTSVRRWISRPSATWWWVTSTGIRDRCGGRSGSGSHRKVCWTMKPCSIS